MSTDHCPAGMRFLIQFPAATSAKEVSEEVRQMFGFAAFLACCIKPGSVPSGDSNGEIVEKGFTVYVPKEFRL